MAHAELAPTVSLPDQTGTLATPDLSVVMPCLNEAETLAACIEQIKNTAESHSLSAEIIVADNGSTDGSREIAASMGVRVVEVPRRGYGSALMGGIAAARGKYVLMGDADCSYNFGDIPKFLAALRGGADLVMGNRFRGGIQPAAMPILHRYFGNPVLTGVGRLLFRSPCGDFHCGLRGFSKAAYQQMDLRTTGMEFASEMVVKASLLGMRICEVPTTLSPDGRSRPPHLRRWRDGWRHLRFLLMYSPRWLFLSPGMLLMLLGTVASLWLLPGPRTIGRITLDIHSLLYSVMAVLIGFQAVIFAIFTKVFAISEGLLPEDVHLNRLFRVFKLETGLIAGAILILLGTASGIYSVVAWGERRFGPLEPVYMVRLVAITMTLLTLGVQVSLSSFFLSILGLRRK